MHAPLFAVSLLGGFFGTWLMRGVAVRLGIVNHPNPIVRDHRKAVPYLGGVGVLLGAAIALFLLFGKDAGQFTQLFGFAAFSLLGLVDDVASLPPFAKLAAQVLLAVAVVSVFCLGGRRDMYWQITAWPGINVVLASLWLVALVNAVNFIDVSDGLAASVAGATLLCWGWLTPSVSSALYIAVGSACVGFLWWNRPPACIYLGDCGSHGLGFLLGVATLQQFGSMARGGLSAASALLCVGVPLFELAFITTVRIRKGLPWWKGSPDHFSLRLQRAGLRKSMIDLLAAGAAIILWFCGMALTRIPVISALLLLAVVLTGLALCWRLLLLWEV